MAMMVRQWLSLALLSSVLMVGFGCERPTSPKVPTQKLMSTIIADYSWTGKDAFSVRHHYVMTYNDARKSYAVEGNLVRVPVGYNGPEEKRIHRVEVSSILVRGLLEAVEQDKWFPTIRPAEVVDHPDDYPNRSVIFQSEPKQVAFELRSTSNSPKGSPWNLYKEKDIILMSEANATSDAVERLFRAIQPEDPQWTPALKYTKATAR